LLNRRFDALEQLIHALLQALVLVDQRIADQHSCHAAVGLSKIEQHADHRSYLLQTRRFLGADLVDQAENRGFDELDQPFKHLSLAGEVPV
jgi:hypothetical protein